MGHPVPRLQAGKASSRKEAKKSDGRNAGNFFMKKICILWIEKLRQQSSAFFPKKKENAENTNKIRHFSA
jgi:hypothetical protein